jgi:hypothetical protein
VEVRRYEYKVLRRVCAILTVASLALATWLMAGSAPTWQIASMVGFTLTSAVVSMVVWRQTK